MTAKPPEDFVPGPCPWCRQEKANAFGLCPHCGRFPNLNAPKMRELADRLLREAGSSHP